LPVMLYMIVTVIIPFISVYLADEPSTNAVPQVPSSVVSVAS
jgi:hypothetical protein